MSFLRSSIDKEQSQRVRDAIRRVLLNVWDPIGIRDEPNAQDEYDSYLGPIYELLNTAASDLKIAEYLHWVAHDRMEFDNAQIADMTDTVLAHVVMAMQEL